MYFVILGRFDPFLLHFDPFLMDFDPFSIDVEQVDWNKRCLIDFIGMSKFQASNSYWKFD